MRNILLTLVLFLGVVSATLHGDLLDKLNRKWQSFWICEHDYSHLGSLDTVHYNGLPPGWIRRYRYYPDDAVVIEDNLITEVAAVIPPKLNCEVLARETPNAS